MLKVLVSAGETSGDEHAAGLILALRAQRSDVVVRAMGGRFLSKAGAELVVNSEQSASVMGFGAVFAKLPQLVKTMKQMQQELISNRPDVLILVDFPDFNLRLAKFAKKLGVPVFYFIPPKLWAWRTYRINAIKRNVDAVAAIFPHEEQFYRSHGYLHARYVGHPFSSMAELRPAMIEEKFRLRQSLGIDPTSPLLAILPGSRRKEIEHHLTLVIETFKKLRQTIPNLQVAIPVPGNLDAVTLRRNVALHDGITVIEGRSVDVLRAADAGLLKSGTSNLQAAFTELPFVMFFVTSAISAFLVRRFVRIKEYSPVNIVRPNSIQEMVQELATAENLAKALLPLIASAKSAEEVKTRERQVVALLSKTGNAYETAAHQVINLVGA